MALPNRFRNELDRALAVFGFALAIAPAAVVATTVGYAPDRAWFVAVVLVAAGAGTAFHELGGDVGDLGSFVLVLTLSFVGLGLLFGTAALFIGVPRGATSELPLSVVGAYAAAYWYAFGGGRERVRGVG